MVKTTVKKERSTKIGVLTLRNEDKKPSERQFSEVRLGATLITSGNWTAREADIAFKTAFRAIETGTGVVSVDRDIARLVSGVRQ